MKNAAGFSRAQIALHWISAVLVVGDFVTHESMIAAEKAVQQGTWGGYDGVILTHTAGGVAVFVFALWRLGLLSRRGAPTLPDGEPLPLRFLAKVVKVLLYTIILLMPLSGAANWFGGIALGGQVHSLMEPLVPLTFLLHVAGALYQQFWLKSRVLTRMLTPELGE